MNDAQLKAYVAAEIATAIEPLRAALQKGGLLPSLPRPAAAHYVSAIEDWGTGLQHHATSTGKTLVQAIGNYSRPTGIVENITTAGQVLLAEQLTPIARDAIAAWLQYDSTPRRGLNGF